VETEALLLPHTSSQKKGDVVIKRRDGSIGCVLEINYSHPTSESSRSFISAWHELDAETLLELNETTWPCWILSCLRLHHCGCPLLEHVSLQELAKRLGYLVPMEKENTRAEEAEVREELVKACWREPRRKWEWQLEREGEGRASEEMWMELVVRGQCLLCEEGWEGVERFRPFCPPCYEDLCQAEEEGDSLVWEEPLLVTGEEKRALMRKYGFLDRVPRYERWFPGCLLCRRDYDRCDPVFYYGKRQICLSCVASVLRSPGRMDRLQTLLSRRT